MATAGGVGHASVAQKPYHPNNVMLNPYCTSAYGQHQAESHQKGAKQPINPVAQVEQ